MNTKLRLYELRKQSNLTQQALANHIGVSQKAIDFWEKEINEPKASYIIELAKFFNVTTDYLLDLEEEDGTKINIDSINLFQKEEQYVIQLYRQLIPVGQKLAISYLENMQEVNTIPKTNKNFK